MLVSFTDSDYVAHDVGVIIFETMYFIFFWKTVIQQARFILKERKKQTAFAHRLLNELETKFNGRFDDATRKKIAVSHGIYNPMIIDAFCALHNRRSTVTEQENLVHYFACSSLLDNFFDRNELSPEAIEAICFHPETYKPSGFDEAVFQHCHIHLLKCVQESNAYWQVFTAEVKAQQDSLKQFDHNIDDETIEAIMKAKGGNAVLMCRYYLNNDVSIAEENCWYSIGTIIQLTNDLFDIYKDINDGIATLATRCTNAYAMDAYVQQNITAIKKQIQLLPCSDLVKKRFSISMAGIYAFSLISINQLKQLQGNKPQLPEFKSLPRKSLIIDMEKPANIIRWFRYVYRFARL